MTEMTVNRINPELVLDFETHAQLELKTESKKRVSYNRETMIIKSF